MKSIFLFLHFILLSAIMYSQDTINYQLPIDVKMDIQNSQRSLKTGYGIQIIGYDSDKSSWVVLFHEQKGLIKDYYFTRGQLNEYREHFVKVEKQKKQDTIDKERIRIETAKEEERIKRLPKENIYKYDALRGAVKEKYICISETGLYNDFKESYPFFMDLFANIDVETQVDFITELQNDSKLDVYVVEFNGKRYFTNSNSFKPKTEYDAEVKEKKERLKSLRAQLKKKYITLYGQNFGTLVAEKKVAIGMSKEMVVSSWGKPNDINRTITAKSTSEQWVFTNSYLYFENGVLTTIQD